MSWTLYILECADQCLYTGITNDLEARVKRHESGRGARYTKGKGPLKVLYVEHHETKSCALKREREIKSWRRSKKLLLVARAPES